MIRNCPNCSIELADKTFDGICFKECPQCAGVWITELELRSMEQKNVEDLRLLEESEKPTMHAAPPDSARPCPICGRAMQHFHFMIDTPIQLDRCDLCEGLWIDYGKLTEMASAIEDGDRPQAGEQAAILKAQGEAVMAQFAAEHARTMDHYKRLTSTFQSFRNRWYIWGI